MAKIQLTDEMVERFLGWYKPAAPRRAPRAWDGRWRAIAWPNNLGFDVGPCEVMTHKDAFGTRTDTRCLRVPFSVTTDPHKAAEFCCTRGLLISELEDMQPEDANRVYMTEVL